MIRQAYRKYAKAEFLTANWFLGRAVAILLLHAFLHLLGWREYTGLFSGTPPAEGLLSGPLATAAGIAYALTYFAALLLAPIFTLTAAILRLLKPRR